MKIFFWRFSSAPHMKLAITRTYNQESSKTVKILGELAPLIAKGKMLFLWWFSLKLVFGMFPKLLLQIPYVYLWKKQCSLLNNIMVFLCEISIVNPQTDNSAEDNICKVWQKLNHYLLFFLVDLWWFYQWESLFNY